MDERGNVIVDAEECFWETVDGRVAGGQRLDRKRSKVLVDVREFRSSLPMAIYARRIEIVPCTIEVGDYILSPKIAVERKSPSDLSQSLKSGRLFKQSQALCRHYDLPILLIEFSESKSFSINFSSFENDADVPHRLALYSLHFPKMGIVWSSSPSATAEIFQDLQVSSFNQENQDPPILEDAQAIGSELMDRVDGQWNQIPYDMLMAIPGITSKNYHSILAKVRNLLELSNLSSHECQEMIGIESGRQVFNFFHDAITQTSKEAENILV